MFTEFKSNSKENALNNRDWKRWVRNLILFSSPAILAVLNALQGFLTNENHLPTENQLVFALGAGYSALLASAIDLFQKYKGGGK